MTKNIVLAHMNDPSALEALYQKDAQAFAADFKQAFAHNQASETLQVWQARLNYQPTTIKNPSKIPVLLLIALCLVAGLLAKLPALFQVNADWYYPRFIPLIVIGTTMAYFIKASASKKTQQVVVAGLSLCVVYAAFLPNADQSDSVMMALIHLPLLAFSLLAISFMSDGWKSAQSRLSFIRYIGETIILSVLILLGGMVLSGITVGLFSLIGLSINRWYTEYIVVIGLVSAPLVATYLFDSVLNRESKFAVVLSNVFSPLFLITIVVYLGATILQGKSPFSDRDFLILFNGLLLAILAITIFSISGRSKNNQRQTTDFINIALLGATLLVNIVALSAIVFRWAEYGVSVNRIVVTGANILIFIHLALLLSQYVKQIWYKGEIASLETSIAKYLPVYTTWSLIVAVVLPLMFRYQ